MFTDRIHNLWLRVQSYQPWEVAIELIVIWVVVYLIVSFLRGTRGARAIRGVVILVLATLLVLILGREDTFERLTFLSRSFLSFVAIALVVIFQPELRRALVRLGEASIFGSRASLRRAVVIEELLEAVAYSSRNKIGLLVAIEREVGLRNVVESGTRVDAVISAELLNTIFWPGSALHDMGVVIQGDRIVAAGVQFPLAEGEQYSSELGSRHRAAIGLSQDVDALIVVVSEETGTISLAERGTLTRNLSVDQLRTHLVRGIGETAMPAREEENGSTNN